MTSVDNIDGAEYNMGPVENPAWHVTGITSTSQFDNTAGPVKAHEVHFTLADGTTDSVVIRARDYTPQAVHEAINDIANKHYSVLSLHGPDLGPSTPTFAPFQPVEHNPY